MSKVERIEQDGWVAIGNGLAAPARINCTVLDEDVEGFWIRLDIRYSPSQMKLVLHSLSLEASEPNAEVNGTVLRTLPLHDYLKSANSHARLLDIVANASSRKTALEIQPSSPADIVNAGPTPESLQEVARLYRIGEVLGIRPAMHVKNVLGFPYPTASNWIARSKAAGYFATPESIAEESELLRVRRPEDYEEGQSLLPKFMEIRSTIPRGES